MAPLARPSTSDRLWQTPTPQWNYRKESITEWGRWLWQSVKALITGFIAGIGMLASMTAGLVTALGGIVGGLSALAVPIVAIAFLLNLTTEFLSILD